MNLFVTDGSLHSPADFCAKLNFGVRLEQTVARTGSKKKVGQTWLIDILGVRPHTRLQTLGVSWTFLRYYCSGFFFRGSLAVVA